MRGDGLGSARQAGVRDEARFCGESPMVLELDPAFELSQFILCGFAFDHHPVCFFDVMFWVGQSFDERAVVGEQEQAFAVAIQSPCGVDVGDVDKFFERGMPRTFICKLREHAIWFVEENISHGYNHTR